MSWTRSCVLRGPGGGPGMREAGMRKWCSQHTCFAFKLLFVFFYTNGLKDIAEQLWYRFFPSSSGWALWGPLVQHPWNRGLLSILRPLFQWKTRGTPSGLIQPHHVLWGRKIRFMPALNQSLRAELGMGSSCGAPGSLRQVACYHVLV